MKAKVNQNSDQPIIKKNHRSAGVLCHISSLASPFGIGDMGPGARRFADFLEKAGQSWWQLLPLTPIDEGQGFSPYSSISGMAGNPLFISAELLADQSLLTPNDLESSRLPSTSKVNFKEVVESKNKMLRKAYRRFFKRQDPDSIAAFKKFTRAEKYWLEDFALYVLLKQSHKGKPWYEWPEEFKLRDEKFLNRFTRQHRDELAEVKWQQFVFAEQWHELRAYCNDRHVKFIGDLPFYVSYDSSDVWSHRDLFSLNKQAELVAVAGVPPDYFNADGQLWGMPVFNWNQHKKSGYAWWIDRLRKNMELYDLLRLDHFRAFADFWEVPAGEKTAVNGEWKEGPSDSFFKALQKKLFNNNNKVPGAVDGKQSLPFIAEDLGKITNEVYELRDQFHLPGMVVLQFAFNEEVSKSIYIPHNYIQNCFVYSGTHDNNTTLGWYSQDLTKESRERFRQYIGHKFQENQVHDLVSRLAYSSVANTAIIPMQDLLGLDEKSRMNTPASASGNWGWRMRSSDINKALIEKMRGWTVLYNRLS